MSEMDKMIEAVEADCTNWYGWADREAALPDGLWEVARSAEHGSLDAALALHKALLPSDWIAEVDTTGFALVYQDEMEVTNNATALLPGFPARAWLLAILRAYRQQRGSGDE